MNSPPPVFEAGAGEVVVEAGAAVGCRTILVRTGHGANVDVESLDAGRLNLAGVVDDLAAAVGVVTSSRASPS